MRSRSFRLLVVLSLILGMIPLTTASAGATTGDLVISGVIDGPLSGGLPKAIELYVVNDIADLSAYGLGSANNGGGTDGEEFTFPAASATAGSFLYIATETTGFNDFFGFGPDYTSSSAASINGDDAIELFMNGSVVDVFGDINVNGTGQPWEYLDGWAYRVDATGADGTTFVLGNWTFSGPNALDGETTNGTAASPFPLGTYSSTSSGPTVLINEVDSDQTGTDSAEFIELTDGGTGNTDLTGLSLVLYNGSDDQSYEAFDLDGLSTGAGGYFVLCANAATVANCDLDVSPDTNLIQNGEDGVALVIGDAADYPNDTAIPAEADIVDAIVYETGNDTDSGLTALLNAGQGVVDEGARGNQTGHSNQRCPDGSGGARNTDTYSQYLPTPGEANVCEDPAELVFIHDIQGSGEISPLVGQTVIIEGVVVGDFQESNQIGGFHVQEEDADADGDPGTSEGIYVFAPNAIDVSIGDSVRVTGAVSEFFDLTELSTFDADAVELIDPVGAATPATLTLPFAAVDDFERYEGMSVVLPQSLVIAEYFNYDRFGEIVLSSERHLQPTAEFAPGSSEAIAAADLIARDRITLDDGQPDQNPDFTRHPNGDAFSLTNRFRGGDTLTTVVGVMDYAFGAWKIQPTGPAAYVNANPRPTSPADPGGDITVASFNVLNYYTTLDEAGSQCFPSNTRSDCRGADDAEEFSRQRAKIIAALVAIDADVVGLIEIENNEGVATADLVAGLNDVLGAGTYSYVDAGRVGTDTIAVAMIYKPGTVTPAGAHAILDTPEFLDPADTGEDRNRAALAQTFTENATGESFTAVINHLKSKSGSEYDDDPDGICVDGDPGNDTPDCDQGDGQSYFNYTRTLAAQELAAWLATDPTGSGDPDVLVLGDLNSYDHEDPIGVLEGAGYIDLVGAFGGEGAYSYVFDGQIGYLDYGMANASLLPAVTGTTVWHLNADEPDLLDYDTTFKSDNQVAIFDGSSPFRSSDHDPVIVGLDLADPMGDKEGVIEDLAQLLPTGDTKVDKQIGKAIDDVTASLNADWWSSDQTITNKKVFDNERQAIVQLELVVAAGGDAAVAAQDAIDMLIDADRQLAQIELIAAIARGGKASKIANAEAAMAEAAELVAAGRYNEAVNAYKSAWDAANKA